ncbi:DUF1059 domain-containing protein [Aurantibacter sp.]|uniref:DUF1059 domain-containing protein n=1 Tax=Aurantibacter sp. TaxID=2807103 RepID=UPI003267AC10
MKTMTCKQLGGACEMEFKANTFEEIAELSKNHGTKMFQAGDTAHLAAMGAMKDLMQKPGAIQKWFMGKKAEFDALSDD